MVFLQNNFRCPPLLGLKNRKDLNQSVADTAVGDGSRVAGFAALSQSIRADQFPLSQESIAPVTRRFVFTK